MKIELGDQSKLTFFQSLYTEARSAAEEQYADLKKHLAQYKGSREIDDSDVEAKAIRNIALKRSCGINGMSCRLRN